jgi:hypothetical protein
MPLPSSFASAWFRAGSSKVDRRYYCFGRRFTRGPSGCASTSRMEVSIGPGLRGRPAQGFPADGLAHLVQMLALRPSDPPGRPGRIVDAEHLVEDGLRRSSAAIGVPKAVQEVAYQYGPPNPVERCCPGPARAPASCSL